MIKTFRFVSDIAFFQHQRQTKKFLLSLDQSHKKRSSDNISEITISTHLYRVKNMVV